ncbi:MAG: hypothetical protein BGO55_05090 [Sphingobacteriales bacterium 50-39]|nr:hypothetical protein [Sphingobacteriales bacterium]OJW55983.1 MAG: hypothetical protein BGO55_05090 [Sphingobacteriales bacterium 50-39]
MNKMISCFAVLTLAGMHVFAQTGEPATPVKTGNEWQMPKDVIVRSKKFSETLRQSLGLDSLTTRKVFDLYLGNTKTVDEIRVGAGSEKQKKDALAVNQLEFDEKVKSVLSPAQSETYARGRKAGRFKF